MSAITRRTAALSLAAASATACVDPLEAPRFAGRLSFRHGVASGDPTADRVVIWTRVTPEGPGVIPVRWVLARDETLSAVVRSGDVEARAESDYTIKVDVDGLAPGQRYFYGFLVGEDRSPVGRTRTLPGSGVAEVKLGVVSCSSFSHGFFNAYEALSRRDDVDFVLHLGDYIYEYGLAGYGGEESIGLARMPRPDVECSTLEDYRARHAQYKEERDLQALHAACPWFVIWDDHEIADDANATDGANHQPFDGEGDWGKRKAAALQAYYEWLPIREPATGKARENAWRSADFGDLATLIILETRLSARSPQLDYLKDLKPISAVWDFKNAEAPILVPTGSPRPLSARDVPTPFDVSTSPPQPITDWRRIRAITPEKPPFGVAFLPDLDALRAKLADPARTLLGPTQESFVAAEIARSRTRGAPWQVFANQTLFARINAPDIARRLGPEAMAALERELPGAARYADLTAFGVPLSLDGWDGYPVARDRLLAAIAATDANALVLTGDSHGAWVNEVFSADGQTRLAAEYAATSVTSPGLGDALANAPFDFDAMLVAANKEVEWSNQRQRGFLLVTLRREEAIGEFFAVSSIRSKDYKVESLARFRTRTVAGPGVEKPEKLTG
jgi:alkaline phosphatase D